MGQLKILHFSRETERERRRRRRKKERKSSIDITQRERDILKGRKKGTERQTVRETERY